MNKNVLIAIIVVAVLGIGGYFMLSQRSGNQSQPSELEVATGQPLQESTSGETVVDEAASGEAAMEKDSAVKTFEIDASTFKFSLTEMKVKKGDKVRVTVTNIGGTHDWVIDEFDARTKQLSDGESDTVEFTADQSGTFEYYCSVGQHRQLGMKGNLIVE